MTPTFVVDISSTVASALREPGVIAAIHEALGQLAAENRKPKTRKERLPPWTELRVAA
jgi:hypothetical protein